MATENNKGIKYPNKLDIKQSVKKTTDIEKKNTIKLIVSNFIESVKSKHM